MTTYAILLPGDEYLDDLVDVCGILAATGDTVEVRPFAASAAAQ